MLGKQSLDQRRLQYALAIAGLVAGVAAVVTLFSAAMLFMFGGMRVGQPLAVYPGEVRLMPSMMPQGALGGGAWLLLVTLYAGLLVGLPAFVILYLGRADAN